MERHRAENIWWQAHGVMSPLGALYRAQVTGLLTSTQTRMVVGSIRWSAVEVEKIHDELFSRTSFMSTIGPATFIFVIFVPLLQDVYCRLVYSKYNRKYWELSYPALRYQRHVC